MILSSAYLAPVEYYSMLKNKESIIIEHYEHFQKQTYRSRCEIYSPNGLLTLSVPLVKRNHRQTMKELKISYDYDWQRLHWRSLEASYRRSPFFEYYEDDFIPYYSEKKFEYLVDLNEALQQLVVALLKLKTSYAFTTEYIEKVDEDYRNKIIPKQSGNEVSAFNPTLYSQVFDTRHSFIPNLSIVDLLFNQGTRAMDYL